MISDLTQKTTLLNKFYCALQKASDHECHCIGLLDGRYPNDAERLTSLRKVALIELRENIHLFIALLNLQRLNLFLGKDIVCFGDAIFIIRKLQLPIIAQMYRHDLAELSPLLDCLTGCCEDYSTSYAVA